MKKNANTILLIKDTQKDNYFGKAIKIIAIAILVFFITDSLIGIFLTKGLNKFYGLGTNAEIALVGHSHLMLGIDKTKLQNELNIPIAKYTREGVNLGDRQIMIQQLLKQNPNLKTVIYGVDAWSFTGEGLSNNSYALFYPFMGIKRVDNYIKERARIGDYWMHKLLKSSRFNETLISSSFRGYLNNWTNLKYGEVDTLRLQKEIKAGQFRNIKNSQINIDILRQTISELNKNEINVILLYVPTIDLYNQAEPELFAESIEILAQLEDEFGNVKFINYLEPWSHNYSLFFDPIHMNPKGQKIVTQQLVMDLQSNM